MASNKDTLKKSDLSGAELISEFTSRYWTLLVFIAILYGAMAWKIYENFDSITGFLNSLTFSNPVFHQFLIGHIETISLAGIVYFTALAFWKFKKWVFIDTEYRVKFFSGILIHRIFTMVALLPFLFYLCERVLPIKLHALWVILFLLFYLSLSPLFTIPKKQRDEILDKNWAMWPLLLGTISLLTACFFIKGLWEPVLVAFVSWVILPSSEALLRTYTTSIENYAAIKRVHSLRSEFIKSQKEGTLAEKIKKFFWENDTSAENPVSMPLAFETLEVLGNMTIAGAFGFIILAWFYNANIITTVYVHISLVLCALHLWLVANKFPLNVDLRIGEKWIKWVFLLERSTDKVLVMGTKGKILFRPEEVSEIRIPLRVGHLKTSSKDI